MAGEGANHQGRAFRVLVVIPTLGERLGTLVRTIASIQGQAGVDVDIVLVVKARTSALVAVADRNAAEVITCAGGISAAINAGFALASSHHRYVSWLGDDDLLRPNALAVAIALLERDKDAVVAYGACDYVDHDGDLLFSRRPPIMAPALLQFIPGLIKQETCVFRLSALRQVGGLDEGLRYTMDLDLLLRLRRVGSFVKADQVLAAFGWHAGSLTVANRNASLVEAQDVQHRHARGITKILQPVWKYPVRYLILSLSAKINRDVGRRALAKDH